MLGLYYSARRLARGRAARGETELDRPAAAEAA
jgi:hypothetical protein